MIKLLGPVFRQGLGCFALLIFLGVSGCGHKSCRSKEELPEVAAWLTEADRYLVQEDQYGVENFSRYDDQNQFHDRFIALWAKLPESQFWPPIERGLRERIQQLDGQNLKASLQYRALLGTLLGLNSSRPESLQELQYLGHDTQLIIQKQARLPNCPEGMVSCWMARLGDWEQSLNLGQQHFDEGQPQRRMGRFLEALARQENDEARASKKSNEPEPPAKGTVDDQLVQRLANPEHYAQLVKLRDEYLAVVMEQSAVTRQTTGTQVSATEFQKSQIVRLQKILSRYRGLTSILEDRSNAPLLEQFFQEKLEKMEDTSGENIPTLEVPDLVAMAGPPEAEGLLRRALRLKVELSFGAGEQTLQLARKVANGLVDQWQVPQWVLAQSPDSRTLFEAMRRRFSTIGPASRYDYKQAAIYHVLALIAANQPIDALDELVTLHGQDTDDSGNFSFPVFALSSLRQAGYSRSLWGFLQAALTRFPDLPYWDDYLELSAELGKNAEALALTQALAEQPGQAPLAQLKSLQRLADAWLADGQSGKGCAILSQMATDLPPQEKEAKLLDKRLEAAIQWAEIARLSSDTVQFNLAVAAAQNLWQRLPPLGNNASDYEMVRLTENLAKLWVRAGHPAEAEALLERLLVLIEKNEAAVSIQPVVTSHPSGSDFDSVESGGSESLDRHSVRREQKLELFATLFDLYNRAKSSSAILNYLNLNPLWEEKDLGGLKLLADIRDPGAPLAVSVAETLLREGRKPQALQILRAQMIDEPSHDDAYALWVEFAGDQTVPFLDQLYALDQFEPRPLIWKARWLLAHGRAAEAEKIAQAAITVDPSDGQQGLGRRMLVYKVMGEIQAALGRPDKAEFFRNIVKAIRVAEQGDEYYKVSLYRRSLDLYQQALGYFQDAYCIQSRLALRLAREGKSAEAEEHYRRAFELMPDSFGRVESHCFGCEYAFDGPQAQGIAEQVLLGLRSTQPRKPQVRYLLGYLRLEEQRYPEALQFFQEAVQLDQQYLNAWKKISEIQQEMTVDPGSRDAVMVKMIELDPGGYHTNFAWLRIQDFPRVWDALVQARDKVKLIRRPDHLYHLAASDAWQKRSPARLDQGSYSQTSPLVKSLRQFSESSGMQPMEQFLRSLEDPGP